MTLGIVLKGRVLLLKGRVVLLQGRVVLLKGRVVLLKGTDIGTTMEALMWLELHV